MKTKLISLPLVFLAISAYAWEDDPRIAEGNERTSYLIKLGNKQVEEKDEEMICLLNFMDEERQKLMEQCDE